MHKDSSKIQLNEIEKYFIAFLLLIHLFIANCIGLSPDEAHYALYAKYLDWSYYDHPPMVGWIQYSFLNLSASEWSLRIVPMASWLFTLYLLLKLSNKVRGKRSPGESNDPAPNGIRLEILIFSLSPMLHLLSVALVPDTLLIPLVLLLMLATWSLKESKREEHGTWLNWISLGLVLGIAGLTKYTAVIFVLPVGIVLVQKFGWTLFFKLKFWVTCIIAFTMILPVLLWNYHHEWISFVYQLNHAAGSAEWLIRKCILFLLVVTIAYGPLIFMSLRIDVKSYGLEDKSVVVFFLLFSAPFLIFLIFLSGKGSTLPHWASPAVVALMPLSALQLVHLKHQSKLIFKSVLSFQVLCAIGLGILLIRGGIGEEIAEEKFSSSQTQAIYAKNNPFADLYGWDAAGDHAKHLLKKYKIEKIVVSNWTLASRIAWYASPHPVNLIDKRQDQFAIWFGTLKENETALWIDWSMMPFAAPISSDQFKSCDLIDQVPINHWGRQIAHFNFSICKGWQAVDANGQ